MEKAQKRILQAIADIGSDLVNRGQIAEQLKVDGAAIQNDLLLLRKAGLIDMKITGGDSSTVWLTPEGYAELQKAPSLREVQGDILRAIGDLSGSRANWVDDSQIADRIGLDLNEVRDHLKLIKNSSDFIEIHESPDPQFIGSFAYRTKLTPSGRIYLKYPDSFLSQESSHTQTEAKLDILLNNWIEFRDEWSSLQNIMDTLETKQLPEVKADLEQLLEAAKEMLEELTTAIGDGSFEVKHKFITAIPIIPFLLSYETEFELSSGIRLSTMWQRLLEKWRNR